MNQKKLINKNFKHLVLSNQNNLRGAVLEGGSRSGKSFAGVHFIIYLCSISEKKLVINIIRETYQSFKTTLWDDFAKILSASKEIVPARDECSYNDGAF